MSEEIQAPINWFERVDKKYLVPNSANFTKRGEAVPESIEGLKEEDLLIKLAGLRDLANKAGFRSVKYDVYNASSTYVCVGCEIKFLQVIDDKNSFIIYQALADASDNSVSGEYVNYLAAIAENRAFSRCVRQFLRINIVSEEEIGPVKKETVSENSHTKKLESLLLKKKLTFEDIKQKMVSDGIAGAEGFAKPSDIPKDVAFDLIVRLKKYKLPDNPVPE